MLREKLSRRSWSESMYYVVDAAGDARFLHGLGEKSGRGRSFLRRLDDHSIAASQRRRDLPGEQEQRKVPGCDYADDPQRLAYRVIQRSEERRVGKECRSRWSPD